MRGQEVCVCPSAAAAGKPLGFEILGFQLQPLDAQSIFDRGFRFSSPCEAGSFTLARKCQIRG